MTTNTDYSVPNGSKRRFYDEQPIMTKYYCEVINVNRTGGLALKYAVQSEELKISMCLTGTAGLEGQLCCTVLEDSNLPMQLTDLPNETTKRGFTS